MNIIITGTSTGIGRALAERLLQHGNRVWGLARSDQKDLQEKYTNFSYTRCDVADWAQVESAAAEVSSAWTTADALITCAGAQGAVGITVDLDPIQWSETVRSNLDGTFYAIRAFYPLLRKAPGRSKVVCFSGGGATKARANFSAYGVAKTGVVRLVETIAEELTDKPIDINAVAPGAINTRLTEEVVRLGPAQAGQKEYDSALKQLQSGGASLDKALGLVEFLISPESDGISGRLISAPWDPWSTLGKHAHLLAKSDVYMLRRIVPEERNIALS